MDHDDPLWTSRLDDDRKTARHLCFDDEIGEQMPLIVDFNKARATATSEMHGIESPDSRQSPHMDERRAHVGDGSTRAGVKTVGPARGRRRRGRS